MCYQKTETKITNYKTHSLNESYYFLTTLYGKQSTLGNSDRQNKVQ